MKRLRNDARACMVAAVMGSPLVALGCVGPAAPPAAPAGGASLALNYDRFAQEVEPVLVAQGCDAGGDCHGGGIRGTLELSPSGAKDVHFDFDQVSLQVNPLQPDSSHILTKPLALAAGGVPHGVKVFATTSDSGYVAIRGWILAGVRP